MWLASPGVALEHKVPHFPRDEPSEECLDATSSGALDLLRLLKVQPLNHQGSREAALDGSFRRADD